jgi:CRISPR-associated protein Cmr6
MIPVSIAVIELLKNYHGNFALWFNKFIEIDENIDFKPVGHPGEDRTKILKKYNAVVKNQSNDLLLGKKHQAQDSFIRAFRDKYVPLVIKAQLKTRLITGLGQTHPTETGMVFDHNIGVPYIPASSIKGLVRFAHRLEKGNGLDETKDSDPETLIPAIFGGNSMEAKGTMTYRGKVIFLDAYPETTPNLELDILNPHYQPYYSDEKGKTPPGDWHEPNPIKFLTVAAKTIFIFRALVPAERQDLQEAVKKAYTTALTDEGVGAKTAVGYGRFTLDFIQDNKPSILISSQPQYKTADYVQPSKPVKVEPAYGTKEYWISKVNECEKESVLLGQLFDAWQADRNRMNDKDIASVFDVKIQKVKKNGKPTAYKIKIDAILGRI